MSDNYTHARKPMKHARRRMATRQPRNWRSETLSAPIAEIIGIPNALALYAHSFKRR